ncbi:SBBP repeat-containing protein [Putridiphycobacter roseus]|nr:SBBP repeat-containing protein [Putridiphycobacter roseus]
MKKIIIIILFLNGWNVFSQGPTYDWIKGIGTTGDQRGNSIAVDNQGNVYTTGYFSNTVDFDPGLDSLYLSANGGYNIFVQKYDSLGNLLWAKGIGNPSTYGNLSTDEGNSIALDNNNNVYVTGRFTGYVDFNPGGIPNYLQSNGSMDNFILKLNPLGQFVWVKKNGGVATIIIQDIECDKVGNTYLTGRFSGNADFDPDPNATNNVSSTVGSGYDIFIQKLNPLGQLVWVTTYTGDIQPQSLSVDSLLNVYITGRYRFTIQFDNNNSITSNNSSYDVFVLKLSSAGLYSWAQTISGTGMDMGTDIFATNSGNVYISGTFTDTIDLNPQVPIDLHYSNGYSDIFFQKLNAINGNFIWGKTIGGIQNELASYIVTDNNENLYITGTFRHTVDFNPGIGVSLQGGSGLEIFTEKLNSSGDFEWVKTFGGTGGDYSKSIAIDSACNLYCTGAYGNTISYSTNNGSMSLTHYGQTDIFVSKLEQCKTTTGVDQLQECAPFLWIDGITYMTSNYTATDTLINALGCDSIVTLNLTIINNSLGVDVQTACNSMTWIDGITYTTSNNTAMDTLTNALGCDSIVTLNLTILNSSLGVDVQTACDSLTWIDGITYTTNNNTAIHTLSNALGCDSVVTLNLTIINSKIGMDVQTVCDSLTWIDGITYTTNNNTATHTLTNTLGCDSVVTLNLTVDPIDNSVLQTGITLFANESGASYQWLDCNNNNSIISGETSQTYTATLNGSYAVEITENGCIDTSSCFFITNVSLEKDPFFNQVVIYPSPSQGLINIDLGSLKNVSLKVYSSTGQLIYNDENINIPSYQFEVKASNGVYLIELNSNKKKQKYKLILE